MNGLKKKILKENYGGNMKKAIISIISVAILVSIVLIFSVMNKNPNKESTPDINTPPNKEASDDKSTSITHLDQRSYDNLDITDVEINAANTLVSGEVQISELFTEPDDLCRDFFKLTSDLFDIKEDMYSNSVFNTNTYPIGPEYSDDKLYAAIGCTGFSSVDFSNGTMSIDEDKVIETINLDNYDNRKVELADSNADINEYVEFADEYYQKYTSLLGIKYHPFAAYIFENETIGRYMMIKYTQCIGDTELNDILATFDEDFNNRFTHWECGYICLTGTKSNNILSINTQGGVLELKESKSADKTISLNKAVAIVNDKLSKYNKYHVENVNIEYLLSDNGNMQKADNNSKLNHRKIAPWAQYASYDSYTFEPYWTFYIDKSYQREIVTYVNLANGDVYFVNNR